MIRDNGFNEQLRRVTTEIDRLKRRAVIERVTMATLWAIVACLALADALLVPLALWVTLTS